MASTTPLIFKRTKAKPAARARQTSPENEDDSSVRAGEDGSPSTLATKLKNKVKRSKPRSRLSFGGDDDEDSGGEVFQVKKSTLSRKLTLGKHPANIPLNLEQATISPHRGPTYDQAYLEELKANTPTSRPTAMGDPYDADMSMAAEEVSMITVDDTDDLVSTEAIIPSESSIKTARERRERLRKTGVSVEEEFISLSVVRRSDEYQGPHPESRLMREEDDLGEGDDEFAEYTSAQDRIALGKKSRKLEATKRRDTMKEMIEDVEDEDEESAEWEQEQLRRGGHLTPASATPATPKVKEVYKPAPIPADTPIPTLNSAMARLNDQLNGLVMSHRSNIAALDSLTREREEVAEREKEMRGMVGRAEEKRAWFDNFKDWLESVASFLDEKYPLLEKLEEEHLSLLQERFEMISNRRRTDDEDDLSVILGPLPVIPPAEPQPEETDEPGRVIPKINSAFLRRERREARVRRRQHRQSRQIKPSEEEGYSTDSSLASPDATAYESALESLASRIKGVLADVKADEFLDPAKGRWGVWRDSYSESYIGAYGGLGVVSVWEFWARLEMVGWDCIENSRNLDSFKWYQGLYAYSRPGDGDDEEHELGPDGDLVASMISKAVIPKISAVVHGGGVDPYSGGNIRRLIHLVEELEASVEGLVDAQARFQSFMQSITGIFSKAVKETEALLAKFKAVQRKLPAFDPESIPARRRFLTRQIKLAGNLVRWRKHVRERSSLDVLLKRLVENCFLDVALSGWDVGGEELSNKMAAILPPDAVSYGLQRRLGPR